MKIIMNGIKNETQARQSFIAIRYAIENKIEEGRNNFKTYTFSFTGITVSVCKNKNSFTTYIQ